MDSVVDSARKVDPVSPFFMIFVEGQRGPAKKHLTYDDAVTEATRLAKQNVGREVHILMPVETAFQAAPMPPPVEFYATGSRFVPLAPLY